MPQNFQMGAPMQQGQPPQTGGRPPGTGNPMPAGGGVPGMGPGSGGYGSDPQNAQNQLNQMLPGWGGGGGPPPNNGASPVYTDPVRPLPPAPPKSDPKSD